jgi:competence ComEA-like helix-hairpin-helix protein
MKFFTAITRTLVPQRSGLSTFAALLSVALFAPCLAHADLPPGPGRDVTIQVCGKCHSPERATALHQNERQWQITVMRMVGLGAQGTDDQFETIIQYLAKNFGSAGRPPVNINDATAVELEWALDLTRPESGAVVQYRGEHGPFKTIADLRNIPGLDFNKVEARKTHITFGSN